MELKEATKTLTPVEYGKLLKRIELRESYLKRLHFSCESRNLAGQGTYEFNEAIGEFHVVEETASVEVRYVLKAKTGDKGVFELEADFVYSYSVEGELPEAFYVIFKNNTVPLVSFPYIREIIHSMSAKAGLPSLVLPMRRNLLAEKEPAKSSKKPTKRRKTPTKAKRTTRSVRTN